MDEADLRTCADLKKQPFLSLPLIGTLHHVIANAYRHRVIPKIIESVDEGEGVPAGTLVAKPGLKSCRGAINQVAVIEVQNVVVPHDGEKRTSAQVIIHLGHQRIAQARPENSENPLPRKKRIPQNHGTRICKAGYGVQTCNIEGSSASQECGLRTIQEFINDKSVPATPRPQLRHGGFLRR